VLNEYQEKTNMFRMGPGNYKINEAGNAALFELAGPNKNKTKTSDCASCKVVTF
jgi:hypothetical protein